MDQSLRTPVALVGLAAALDLAAAPFFLAGEDASVGVVALVLGILTLGAAIGLWRGARWARPAAIATRAVDGLLALPGVFVGGLGAGLLAGVAVLLSAAAIVVLVRMKGQLAVAR